MPTLEELILRTGDVISEDWFLNHYNIHKTMDELLFGVTCIIRYGYVYSSLIPYAPSIVDVGSAYKPFRNVFADFGYFNENVFVQNKRVIKDGDPITIADLLYQAQAKITYAVYNTLKISLLEHRDALKPDRSTPTQELSSHELSASGVAEIIKSNLSGWSTIVVTVRATYNANATNGVRVRWLFSPDGTNYDSVEDAEAEGNYVDLTFSAGETRQRTILLPILTPYVKIQIVNLDSSYSVVVDVWTILMR